MNHLELFLRQVPNMNTKRSYIHTLQAFLAEYPDCVNASYVEARQAVRNWLFEKGYKTQTGRARLSAICAFFKFLQAEGFRQDNPTQGIKIPNEIYDGMMPIFPSTETIEQIIEVTKQDTTPVGKRNHALLMCLKSGGFRVSEVLNLTPEDFDSFGKVKIRKAKRNKWRITGVSQECLDAVNDWITAKDIKPDQRLFNITDRQVNRIIASICEQGNIKIKVSAHGFRHAWATAHVKRNTNLSALMVFGGWSTPRMINTYVTQEGLDVIGI